MSAALRTTLRAVKMVMEKAWFEVWRVGGENEEKLKAICRRHGITDLSS
ncbi:MAG: hypothetical protein K6U03_00765 [Firmicutes bacterium]|nr:hypothetical protein [Bacillota bacterium]